MNTPSSKVKPFSVLTGRFAGLMVISLCLLLAFIVVITGPSAAPLERVETSWPVSVVTAEPVNLSPVFFTYGKVESRQVANLKTSISAPVAEVLKHEGEWVQAGDLMIQLDTAEIVLAKTIAQANYDRNVAMLDSVRTDYELSQNLVAQYQQLNEIVSAKLNRAIDLHNRGMISDADLDVSRQEASEQTIRLEEYAARVKDFPNKLAQQQANVDESAAYLEKANIDLDQTRISAPFTGRVIKNEVTQGDRVIAGTSLIQVADYGGLEIRASVPSDIGYRLRANLQRGENIIASAEVDGRSISFPLSRLAADVKPGQSGIDAFFEGSMDEVVDIGRTVQLTIALPVAADVIAMPVHALYQDHTLFKVIENRLEAVFYEEVGDYVSEQGDFNVLIRSNQVKPGDQLMVSQLPRAITGLLVEPIDQSNTTLTIN